MPEIINWKLALNPINWFIVVLMLLIAGYALHVILPSSITNQSGTSH